MAQEPRDPKSATGAVAEKPAQDAASEAEKAKPKRPREIGGPEGLEPTRYGDWERKGRVSDF